MLQNDNEKLGNVQLKVKRLFIYCHLHDDDDDDDLHEHDQQRFTVRFTIQCPLNRCLAVCGKVMKLAKKSGSSSISSSR